MEALAVAMRQTMAPAPAPVPLTSLASTVNMRSVSAECVLGGMAGMACIHVVMFQPGQARPAGQHFACYLCTIRLLSLAILCDGHPSFLLYSAAHCLPACLYGSITDY